MDNLDRFARSARERLAAGYYSAGPASPGRPRCSLAAAIRDRWGKAVVAEVKPRSPTAPDLLRGRGVAEVARAYLAGGAAGISVLVDPDHFGGSLAYLGELSGLGIPLLAKDFVVDPAQLLAYARAGADCALLILTLFRRGHTSCGLGQMIREAHALELEVLLEVSSTAELEEALGTEADLIGINSRDLATLELDPRRPIEVIRAVSPGDPRPILALSGISSPEEIRALREAGFAGFLVGTALLRAPDPAALLRELTT
ncbi:indole-3-glycerol-phosphate synthase [Candidatus Bipolaricaulota sp. J31]